MEILGIDFTSAPSPTKPITCIRADLDDHILSVRELERWINFAAFESALMSPGPWIAGIDFPFGQARRFIDNVGWPDNWVDYVNYVSRLTRNEFRAQLDTYRQGREIGDKEHRRKTDIAAGSISPQKLYGTPVGLMFFEGAPRLLKSGVSIPGVHVGDPQRVVVEAYPGVLIRQLIGRQSYKQDTKARQTSEQHDARRRILELARSERLVSSHGVKVVAPNSLVDDPGGDDLDALLCAVQAAWALRQQESHFGAPPDLDSCEGWIADPSG